MEDVSITNWLESLAARTPTPGGGAVAALAGAVAAAQLGMVIAYTTGPKWQEVADQMVSFGKQVADLQAKALQLAQTDAEAFAAVGAAYKLPKITDTDKAKRAEAIQAALKLAAQPPCQVAIVAAKLVQIAAEVAKNGNPSVTSDVAVAAAMAQASLQSAVVNILINQVSIKDQKTKQNLQKCIDDAQSAMLDCQEVINVVYKAISK